MPDYYIPHPKQWKDSVAQADMDDNRSWANVSPYRCDQAYLRDYGVSVSPESAEALRSMRTAEDYTKKQIDTLQEIKFSGPKEGLTSHAGIGTPEFKSALDSQVGSDHYKTGTIQPLEFITKNNLSFIIGNCIKYLFRADKKGGAEDIRKAIHYCQLELELKYGVRSEIKYDK